MIIGGIFKSGSKIVVGICLPRSLIGSEFYSILPNFVGSLGAIKMP